MRHRSVSVCLHCLRIYCLCVCLCVVDVVVIRGFDPLSISVRCVLMLFVLVLCWPCWPKLAPSCVLVFCQLLFLLLFLILVLVCWLLFLFVGCLLVLCWPPAATSWCAARTNQATRKGSTRLAREAAPKAGGEGRKHIGRIRRRRARVWAGIGAARVFRCGSVGFRGPELFRPIGLADGPRSAASASAGGATSRPSPSSGRPTPADESAEPLTGWAESSMQGRPWGRRSRPWVGGIARDAGGAALEVGGMGSAQVFGGSAEMPL